jgi:hypothetical protein
MVQLKKHYSMVQLKKHYTKPTIKVFTTTFDSILSTSPSVNDEYNTYDQLAKPERFGAFANEEDKSSSSPWGN